MKQCLYPQRPCPLQIIVKKGMLCSAQSIPLECPYWPREKEDPPMVRYKQNIENFVKARKAAKEVVVFDTPGEIPCELCRIKSHKALKAIHEGKLINVMVCENCYNSL